MLTFRLRYVLALLLCCLSVSLSACGDDNEPGPAPADAIYVQPHMESQPAAGATDAAIWVNPDDPDSSLVVASYDDGLLVYDFSGDIVFRNADGRMNNVDLRAGVTITTGNADPSTAREVILVAATNRTQKTIGVYVLEPETGELSPFLDEPIPSNFEEPYGLCLYRSAVNGNLYVFASETGGTVSQWFLYDTGRGSMRGTIQRTWKVGRRTGGCVADDANGVVYLDEAGAGIWRYGAEPKDSFGERAQVASAGAGFGAAGGLSADVEGLSLYIPDAAAPEAGYLIASNRGAFAYVVYDRAPPHAYRGTFRITDNTARGVDGAQGTGGLDVVAVPVGPDYPEGLLVAQDGLNKNPDGSGATPNFKLISWADVAEALGLE
jgi:3-phytase